MMINRKKRIESQDILEAFREFPQAKEGLRVRDITRFTMTSPNAYPKMFALIKDRDPASRARSITKAFQRLIEEEGGNDDSPISVEIRPSIYVPRQRKNVKSRRVKKPKEHLTGKEDCFYILN